MATLTLTLPEVTPLLDSTKKHSDEKVQIIIDDVLARVIGHVPQLGVAIDESQLRTAKAIVRKIVVRELDRGSGGVITQNNSQSTGGFSTQDSTTIDNSKSTWLIYPSEITELRAIVANERPSAGKAFSIDMLGGF